MKVVKVVSILTIVLSVVGCGVFSSHEAAIEPTEILVLDGEFEWSESIEKGDVVALDMKVPKKSGYNIVGASFDPAILRLEHYLEYADDDMPRIQYMFSAVADGTTDVLVKMQPLAGGDSELYKRVTVNVGHDDSLF